MDATTVFTGIIALLTAAYVFTTWRQLNAMQAALEETRRSNENTAESNRIQRDAMIAANRAWVGPATLPNKAPNGFVGLDITIQNKGGSAATNILGVSGVAVVDQPLEKLPESEPSGTATSMAVLFPDARVATTLAAGAPLLDSETIVGIKAGSLFIYYYATFTYSDVFGQHETHFCAYYNARGQSWDHAPFGNWAT